MSIFNGTDILSDPEAAQYAYATAGSLEPGLEVTCDTNTGICRRGRFSFAASKAM